MKRRAGVLEIYSENLYWTVYNLNSYDDADMMSSIAIENPWHQQRFARVCSILLMIRYRWV